VQCPSVAGDHGASRLAAFGYRTGEVLQDEKQPVDKNSGFRVTGPSKTEKQPMYTSMGCHVEGQALPAPDVGDRDTMVAGYLHRMCREHLENTQINPKILTDFRNFVYRKALDTFDAIDADFDPSFDSWIENTNYPKWRKDQLRNTWNQAERTLRVKDHVVKAFMKHERYPKYKHARGIYSRTDTFKAFSGPVFKEIERVVFAFKGFIKKIPVSERPNFIMDNICIEGYKYMISDFSSFESSFGDLIQRNCEFCAYYALVGRNEPMRRVLNICENVICGPQRIYFRHFQAFIVARRMSGEMCTSLGNGLTNMMVNLFNFERCGLPEPKFIVEGDDGLFTVPSDREPPSPDLYRELGFTIKTDCVENLEEASFCGLVFDSVERINVTDPLAYMCKFGWMNGMYHNSAPRKLQTLLRVKALSCAYSYPGMPILWTMAKRVLKHTEDITDAMVRRQVARSASMSQYEKDKWFVNLSTELDWTMQPGPRTRELVARLYQIPVSMQLALEDRIEKWDPSRPFALPLTLHDDLWSDYFYRFCRHTKVDRTDDPRKVGTPGFEFVLTLPAFSDEWKWNT